MRNSNYCVFSHDCRSEAEAWALAKAKKEGGTFYVSENISGYAVFENAPMLSCLSIVNRDRGVHQLLVPNYPKISVYSEEDRARQAKLRMEAADGLIREIEKVGGVFEVRVL